MSIQLQKHRTQHLKIKYKETIYSCTSKFDPAHLLRGPNSGWTCINHSFGRKFYFDLLIYSKRRELGVHEHDENLIGSDALFVDQENSEDNQAGYDRLGNVL